MVPGPGFRRHVVVALLAVALAGAAFVGLRRWREAERARTRMVVAVFTNRTGDASLEPFGSMAADWITRGLARTPSVEVVDVGALYVQGRGASGQPTDPLELARRNGAGSAVAGSYYVADDTLVVRSSVVDVATGEILETVTPVRVPKGQSVRALELLQQYVMTAVAGALEVEFRPFTAQPTPPPPYAAYHAFVAGQAAYWQGRPATESRDFFTYAVASDSSFLTAAVWLAFVGANGAGCGLTDSVAQALASRTDALSRFDRLTLDISAARCADDWHRAYRLAAEQAALRPRSTYAVYTAGFFAVTSGRPRAAVELLGSIDPDHDLGWLSDSAKSVYWRDYTAAEHLLGQYDTELSQARRLERRFPERSASHLVAARALAGLHRGRESIEELDRIMQLPVDRAIRMKGSLSLGLIAYTLAIELLAHGDSLAARQALDRAIGWYEGGPDRFGGRYEHAWYARSLLLAGRRDEALAEASVGSRADSTDVTYLGLRGFLAASMGAGSVAQELDGRLAAIELRDGSRDHLGPSGAHRRRRRRPGQGPGLPPRGDRAGHLARPRRDATSTSIRCSPRSGATRCSRRSCTPASRPDTTAPRRKPGRGDVYAGVGMRPEGLEPPTF